MYPVSDRFLKEIRGSTRRISVADIYYGNVKVYSDIPISQGTVNVDRSAQIRRSGSFVVSKKNLDHTILEPWGTEVLIRSGVQFTDRTRELVPLGIFRIEDIYWNDGAASDITIDFFDRGKALEDAGTLTDRDFSKKRAYDAINIAVSNVWDHAGYIPSVILDPTITNLTLPSGSVYSDTHLDLVSNIVEAMGGEQFFDVYGNLQLKAIPSITPDLTEDDADWIIDVGPQGVAVVTTPKHARTEAFNAVAVYGATKNDASSDRVFAQAFDLSSNNHAGYFSPFGKKSKRIDNSALTTNLQCLLVAQQQLKNLAGVSKTIEFTSLLNPALFEGDIVMFKFMDGTSEIHLVDTLAIDLHSGEMTGTTRTAQYIV